MEAARRVTVVAEESGGRGDLGLDPFFKALLLIGDSPRTPAELLLPALGILCLVLPPSLSEL